MYPTGLIDELVPTWLLIHQASLSTACVNVFADTSRRPSDPSLAVVREKTIRPGSLAAKLSMI